MPFLRLDGYYIVSDLTGVPDILSRIKPVLSSLLPWRKADDRVTELKPWVRVVVTGYIVILVPVLAGLLDPHARARPADVRDGVRLAESTAGTA